MKTLLGVLLGILLWASAGHAQSAPMTQCVVTAAAGGTSDALTIPTLPCIPTTALLLLNPQAANQTATPTLTYPGSTPKPIVQYSGGLLSPGMLVQGGTYLLIFNGTKWKILTAVSPGSPSIVCTLPQLLYANVYVNGNLPCTNTGTGNVSGPGSSTSGWFPQWNGTTGTALSLGVPGSSTEPIQQSVVLTNPVTNQLDTSLIPFPSLTTLGGVEALNATPSHWINSLSVSGVLGTSQPSFTDLLGSTTLAQMPQLQPYSLYGNNTNVSAVPTANIGIPSSTCSGTGAAANWTGSSFVCVNITASNTNFLTPSAVATTGTSNALPNSPVYSNGSSGVGATLTAGTNNVHLVIDSVTITINQTVLVNGQATAANNGVYTLTQDSGASTPWILTRSTNNNQTNNIAPGQEIGVTGGATFTNTFWIQTTPSSPTVGTTAITWLPAANPTATLPITASNGNIAFQNINGTSVPANTTGSAAAPSGQIPYAATCSANTLVETGSGGGIAAACLPVPTASTLGGVESLAAVSHKWINTISTSGVPSATQPAFTDISGQTTLAQLPTLSANQVLGATSATTPSGLAMPSCSTGTSALIWTSGTGFGCNSISSANTWAVGTTVTASRALVIGDVGHIIPLNCVLDNCAITTAASGTLSAGNQIVIQNISNTTVVPIVQVGGVYTAACTLSCTSQSVSFPVTNLHDLIIITANFCPNSGCTAGTPTTVSSITDTAGNVANCVLVIGQSATTTNSVRDEMWACPNTAVTGADTWTINLTASNYYLRGAISEWSGVALSSVAEVANSGTATASSWTLTTNGNPTVRNDLIYASAAGEGTGNGIATGQNDIGSGALQGERDGFWLSSSGAGQTQTMTWTQNGTAGQTAQTIAAFKPKTPLSFAYIAPGAGVTIYGESVDGSGNLPLLPGMKVLLTVDGSGNYEAQYLAAAQGQGPTDEITATSYTDTVWDCLKSDKFTNWASAQAITVPATMPPTCTALNMSQGGSQAPKITGPSSAVLPAYPATYAHLAGQNAVGGVKVEGGGNVFNLFGQLAP